MSYFPQGSIYLFPIVITLSNDYELWLNQPAAVTEFSSVVNRRVKVDLSGMTQVRFVVNVNTAGFAGSIMALQYSTDQVAWDYLDGVSGPSVPIGTTGVKVSSYVNIVSAARADVFLRIVGQNGNGVRDPDFWIISAQFINT